MGVSGIRGTFSGGLNKKGQCYSGLGVRVLFIVSGDLYCARPVDRHYHISSKSL